MEANPQELSEITYAIKSVYDSMSEGYQNYINTLMFAYNEHLVLFYILILMQILTLTYIVILIIKLQYWKRKYNTLKKEIRRDIDKYIYN